MNRCTIIAVWNCNNFMDNVLSYFKNLNYIFCDLLWIMDNSASYPHSTKTIVIVLSSFFII